MTTADTDTAAGALGAMLAHHVALAEGVRRRVDAVCTTVERGDHHGMATAELVAYLAKEVLPHATAEEDATYRAAAAKEELAETVEGLVDEHRTLLSLARRLATAGDGVSAAAAARAIGTLFAAHVGKEDELILLPLAADQAVDLAGLADQMHRLIEAAQGVLPEPGEATAPDTEATLLQLLLDGARLLANGEQGDAACRLAAEAWATVRAPRPDLAVRATAALHGLVGPLRGEGAGLRTGTRLSATAGAGTEAVLDVRALAPAQRHERIFATYGDLGPGTAFVLVNDHDPKPLRYQFEAEHRGDFSWDVLEAGPAVWRVRIGRPARSLA